MSVLTLEGPSRLTAKRNTQVAAKVDVRLRSGYHVNSHQPSDDYLIPLRLSWAAAPLEVLGVDFPTPRMERYAFSDKPLSVFSGDFSILTRFRVPAAAPLGMQVISGKLRYQACNNKECLPPRTAEIKLTVGVVD